MFVKQLIGRLAGTVVDMPFSAATSNIAAGTCVEATEAEIAAAGLEVAPVSGPADPDVLPAGYRAELCEGGGYDLIDAGGVRLNQEPFGNLPALRSFASEHLATMAPVAVVIPLDQIPGGPRPTFTLDDYRFETLEGGGIVVLDPAGVRVREDAFADDDAALDAAREHYAVSRNMTLEQLDAEEAGVGARVAVPAEWRNLHHTQRRALAQRIKGEPVANTAEADAVIEAHVAQP